LIVFAGIFGTGMGMAYASIPNLLIEAVPPQLQASTASIVGVSQSVFRHWVSLGGQLATPIGPTTARYLPFSKEARPRWRTTPPLT
ncbi:hypothetical protein, partial [Nocardia cyriacigeorgica]|uniref:hypothetical protein n=1 Tax=Nocardia cyriacigeorgica TaxID=135487 RepID=UPI00245392A4